MPGAPIVIGNYNSTIFLGRDLQFCTELDTKEETVSRLIRRSLPRICARVKQDNFQTGVEQGFALSRVARPRIEFGVRFELSGKCGKKAARADHPTQQRRE